MAYLYVSLDSDLYMKIFKGYKMFEAYTPHNLFSIKLQRSLFVLKKFCRTCYKCLSENLTKKRYANDPICPCIFIKKSKSGFAIVEVYVDEMNLMETP